MSNLERARASNLRLLRADGAVAKITGVINPATGRQFPAGSAPTAYAWARGDFSEERFRDQAVSTEVTASINIHAVACDSQGNQLGVELDLWPHDLIELDIHVYAVKTINGVQSGPLNKWVFYRPECAMHMPNARN